MSADNKNADEKSGKAGGEQLLLRRTTVSVTCIVLWISLSAVLILFNKYILTMCGFPYPIALAMMHMAFCTVTSQLIVRVFRWVASPNMDQDMYMKTLMPIGILYACSLSLSNAAYLHITVSFIQMLKALMPVLVYAVGVVLRTETFAWGTLANMVVVTIGVIFATHGELQFVLTGFLEQLASLLSEAFRLTLLQILLQREGVTIKLNPVTTMYYFAPTCFIFLSVPFVFLEASVIAADEDLQINVPLFLANCACAMALNLSVYLLIGKTSALTMNVSGVVKDFGLIYLSAKLFDHRISTRSMKGYFIAIAGVSVYNYTKWKAVVNKGKLPIAKSSSPKSTQQENLQPLLHMETLDGAQTVNDTEKKERALRNGTGIIL